MDLGLDCRQLRRQEASRDWNQDEATTAGTRDDAEGARRPQVQLRVREHDRSRAPNAVPRSGGALRHAAGRNPRRAPHGQTGRSGGAARAQPPRGDGVVVGWGGGRSGGAVPIDREGRPAVPPSPDPVEGGRGPRPVVRASIAAGGSPRASPELAGSAEGRTRYRVGRRGRGQGALPRSPGRRAVCDLPPREPARPSGAREAPRSRRARSLARLARLRVSGSRHPLQGGRIRSRAHGARPASHRPAARRPDAHERGQALPPRGADRRRATLPPSRGRGVPEPEPQDRDGRGAPGARVRGQQGRRSPRRTSRARPRDRDLRGDVEPAGPDTGAERDGAGRTTGRVPPAGQGPPRAVDLAHREQRPTDPRLGPSRDGSHAR